MGVRTRRARQHSKTHAVKFGIAGAFGFIALFGLALAFSLSSLISSWLQDLPDYTSADAYVVGEPTTVYAADHSVIAEFYLQNRRSVSEDQISPYVLKAIVDTEDSRFYKHNGVDPQGIIRAVVKTARGGSEGASTITQQLVRNTVLSKEQFEQTIRRKVREAYISIQMEKMYTKDQILNMYLNTIYFGHGAYGIQAAAITYFNKNAKDLTLAESATLAGLPQAPSSYDPLVNPDNAVTRRNIVLQRMLSSGDITQDEYDSAIAESLQVTPGKFSTNKGRYPYFADYIKQLLLADFDKNTVMQGGLKVYTTLDPVIQDKAQEVTTRRLKLIGNKRLEAALVAVEPQTGYIKAMIGGKDYSSNQFNLATQAYRQTGSAFKTFTLACAINNGMSPQTRVNCNSPIQVTPLWTLGNFGNQSFGTISVQQAFAVSSNTGFVQIAQTLGNSNVAEMAHNLGIHAKLDAYDSMTLGVDGVPVVQMAEAYATIAAGGQHRDAIAITKIEDRNGNTVYEHKDTPSQIISAEVARATIDVMKGVCKGGGTAGQLARTVRIKQPIAGKTGTSQECRDLWFCGITPNLSVAIWFGYIEEVPVRVGGGLGHPYNTAVPLFGDFINAALSDAGAADFPAASGTIDFKPNNSWTFKFTSDNANTGETDTLETIEEEQKLETINPEQPNRRDNHNQTTTPSQPNTQNPNQPNGGNPGQPNQNNPGGTNPGGTPNRTNPGGKNPGKPDNKQPPTRRQASWIVHNCRLNAAHTLLCSSYVSLRTQDIPSRIKLICT